MMTLPSQLQQRLDDKIKQFEEERTMPLLSNMELRGIERGKKIGKKIGTLQNARHAVITVLKTRLGEIPSNIGDSLDQVSDLSILDEMLKLAATVNSFEEFQQTLPNSGNRISARIV
jgi:hypothetical protein